MTKEEINEILELHRKWLIHNKDGKRADFREEDLREINLREAVLCEADLNKADLQDADLRQTILQNADLSWSNLMKANLQDADLSWANLSGANLIDADLRGANLWEANLQDANLNGVDLRNVKNLPLSGLNILKYQKEKIRAFKLVNKNFVGVIRGLRYVIGEEIEDLDYDSDERILCSKGLNVATFEWCLKNRETDNKILEVEFYAKDIVAIPYATDGVFRIKRCKVIKEWKGKGKN